MARDRIPPAARERASEQLRALGRAPETWHLDEAGVLRFPYGHRWYGLAGAARAAGIEVARG